MGFNATNDTTGEASTTINTNGGGVMTVKSLIPGSTASVSFVEGDATNGPTVSVASNGNVTVTVNDAAHGGLTTLSSVVQALNNYTDSDGRQVFQANVVNAGDFNTNPNSSGIAPDGPGLASGGAAAAVNTKTTLDGSIAGDKIVLDAIGASANGANVIIQEGATAGAVWNPTGGANGKGQLTLTLTTAGGADGGANTWDGTDIANLLGSATLLNGATSTPFGVDASTTSLSVTGSGSGLTDDLNSAVTGTVADTGTYGYTTGMDPANFSGGGVGTVLQNGTGTSGLAANLTIQVGGNAGGQLFTFNAGTTAAQMATAINQASQATGIQATTIGDQLLFNSTDYGSAATASVQVVSEGTGGTFGSSLTAVNATGSDIQATVNGVAATGQGNTVSLNTPSLSFSAALDPTQLTVGENVDFNVTGGGALFQLGPTVTSAQQVNLGIQSVSTASLGGTVGQLYEIGSGQNASLTNNAALAGQIVQAALNSITSLRGQLGAFQTATLDSNISTLTNAVTNLTAAQSDIQDADFASESANLTKQQILVQSGTTVLGIANSNPANVLTLLQKASSV